MLYLGAGCIDKNIHTHSLDSQNSVSLIQTAPSPYHSFRCHVYLDLIPNILLSGKLSKSQGSPLCLVKSYLSFKLSFSMNISLTIQLNVLSPSEFLCHRDAAKHLQCTG